jgi:hypothetical protein
MFCLPGAIAAGMDAPRAALISIYNQNMRWLDAAGVAIMLKRLRLTIEGLGLEVTNGKR